MDNRREEGREGGGKEGGREGGWEGWREGGREGGSEGEKGKGCSKGRFSPVTIHAIINIIPHSLNICHSPSSEDQYIMGKTVHLQHCILRAVPMKNIHCVNKTIHQWCYIHSAHTAVSLGALHKRMQKQSKECPPSSPVNRYGTLPMDTPLQ